VRGHLGTARLAYNFWIGDLILLKYFQPLPYGIVTVHYQEVLTLHHTNHAHQVESNQIKQFTFNQFVK